jgi:hypothetical protein
MPHCYRACNYLLSAIYRTNHLFSSLSASLLVILNQGGDVEEIHLLQDLLDGQALPSRHVGLTAHFYSLLGSISQYLQDNKLFQIKLLLTISISLTASEGSFITKGNIGSKELDRKGKYAFHSLQNLSLANWPF